MRKLGFEVDARDPDATARSARAFVEKSCTDIEWFWQHALQDMDMLWYEPYGRMLDASRGPAWADWFVGGETNIVGACVDRHARGERVAETEDGAVRSFSFAGLSSEVGRLANALRALGVGPGDRVACYLPMVAEVV